MLARRLSEGVILRRAEEGGNPPPGEMQFCSDPKIQARLEYLHSLARKGDVDEVQQHIDSHLAAVGYLRENPSHGRFARMMIVSHIDAPQWGTLPDIGFIIRAVLSGGVMRDPVKACGGGKTLKGKVAWEASGRLAAPAAVPEARSFLESVPTVPQTPCCSRVDEDNYSVQMLFQALPCVRRAHSKRGCGGSIGQEAGINILMGMLLGLYPHAVKFPPFSARVEIYMAIHRLLTHGTGVEFCKGHPMLMTLAYMEYCAYVIPEFMPAEYEILKVEPGMAGYFTACPLACDVLRQELLNNVGCNLKVWCDHRVDAGEACAAEGTLKSGTVDWAALEAHCTILVDKHIRACKNRARALRDEIPNVSKLNSEAVGSFASLPFLPSYDVHVEDTSHCIRAGELAFLSRPGSDPSILASVAVMQRLIQVYPLPRNLTQMQLRSLHARMRVCERSAMDGMMLHICSICGLTAGGHRGAHVKGQCRMDASESYWLDAEASGARPGDLLCTTCQRRSVMAVNTLGRVVVLRQQRYYLAPCCFSVQVYTGSGGEFQTEYCDPDFYGPELMERLSWRPNIRPSACLHRKVRASPKQQRLRCEVCVENGVGSNAGGSANPEMFSAVDHMHGVMRSIRLCHRHAPPAEALKYVCNWRQLMVEVQRRDRPLFSRRRMDADV